MIQGKTGKNVNIKWVNMVIIETNIYLSNSLVDK